MAFAYVAAGVNHFIHPEFYRKIMPPWVPWHETMILISGVLEIVLGLLLLPRGTRRAAAWGLVVLLVLIFPANIQMMLNYAHVHHPMLWVAILRLPLQGLLIWWAYRYTRTGKKRPYMN